MNSTQADALQDLVSAAARRFATHEGRIGRDLATALDEMTATGPWPRPAASQSSTPSPCAALPSLLQCADPDFAGGLAACAPALNWREPGFGRLPRAIADRMAVAEIVGPTGVLRHERIRFGVLLQLPGVFYPDHSHAAEELYLTISGRAWWTMDDDPPAPRSPGVFIHHPPWRMHSTETREDPMLAFWGWTGDIGSESYGMAGAARAGASGPPMR